MASRSLSCLISNHTWLRVGFNSSHQVYTGITNKCRTKASKIKSIFYGWLPGKRVLSAMEACALRTKESRLGSQKNLLNLFWWSHSSLVVGETEWPNGQKSSGTLACTREICSKVNFDRKFILAEIWLQTDILWIEFYLSRFYSEDPPGFYSNSISLN